MFHLSKKSVLLVSATTFLLACSATQTSTPEVNNINATAPQPKIIKATPTTGAQSQQLT
jgi:hypothetical protein